MVFLPKPQNCSIYHLQDILTDRKKYLSKKDVPQVTVPNWPELSLKKVWPKVRDLPTVQDYLPEEMDPSNPAKADRDFVWGILSALY